jgi:uncharacterized protein GlcG (DUF336 family)
MNMKYKPFLAALLASMVCLTALAAEPLVTFRSISPDSALELARASLKSCRDAGYQVAVAVVDRMGIPQVMLRDRYAGPHTPDTATRLAWTAVSFRSDTLALARDTQAGSGLSGAREIGNVLMIGGGIPVRASGTIVGGIGVSGTPSGADNDRCARDGMKAMTEKFELAD